MQMPPVFRPIAVCLCALALPQCAKACAFMRKDTYNHTQARTDDGRLHLLCGAGQRNGTISQKFA